MITCSVSSLTKALEKPLTAWMAARRRVALPHCRNVFSHGDTGHQPAENERPGRAACDAAEEEQDSYFGADGSGYLPAKSGGLDSGADDYLVKPFDLVNCSRVCAH